MTTLQASVAAALLALAQAAGLAQASAAEQTEPTAAPAQAAPEVDPIMAAAARGEANMPAPTPVAAQSGADALPGTWECYGPGQRSPRTPPIVYFAAVQRAADGAASIFIDGFARTVNGRASVVSDADALRVSIADTNLHLHDFAEHGSTLRMVLDRDGVGSYHCYRLPGHGDLSEESSAPAPGAAIPTLESGAAPAPAAADPAAADPAATSAAPAAQPAADH